MSTPARQLPTPDPYDDLLKPYQQKATASPTNDPYDDLLKSYETSSMPNEVKGTDFVMGENGAQPVSIRTPETQSRVHVPVVTNPFGAPRSYGQHTGIDLRFRLDSPVSAFAGGRVVKAANTGKGYGNRIEVQDAQGRVHTYSHLNRIDVKAGDVIQPGQSIGLSGNTGGEYAPHLHYEVIENGRKINPASFLSTLSSPPTPTPINQTQDSTATPKRAAPLSRPPARPTLQAEQVAAQIGQVMGNPYGFRRTGLPSVGAQAPNRDRSTVGEIDPTSYQLRARPTQPTANDEFERQRLQRITPGVNLPTVPVRQGRDMSDAARQAHDDELLAREMSGRLLSGSMPTPELQNLYNSSVWGYLAANRMAEGALRVGREANQTIPGAAPLQPFAEWLTKNVPGLDVARANRIADRAFELAGQPDTGPGVSAVSPKLARIIGEHPIDEIAAAGAQLIPQLPLLEGSVEAMGAPATFATQSALERGRTEGLPGAAEGAATGYVQGRMLGASRSAPTNLASRIQQGVGQGVGAAGLSLAEQQAAGRKVEPSRLFNTAVQQGTFGALEPQGEAERPTRAAVEGVAVEDTVPDVPVRTREGIRVIPRLQREGVRPNEVTQPDSTLEGSVEKTAVIEQGGQAPNLPPTQHHSELQPRRQRTTKNGRRGQFNGPPAPPDSGTIQAGTGEGGTTPTGAGDAGVLPRGTATRPVGVELSAGRGRATVPTTEAADVVDRTVNAPSQAQTNVPVVPSDRLAQTQNQVAGVSPPALPTEKAGELKSSVMVRHTPVRPEEVNALPADKRQRVLDLITEYRRSGYIDATMVLPDQWARTSRRQQSKMQDTTLRVFKIESEIKELLKPEAQVKQETLDAELAKLNSRQGQLERGKQDIEHTYARQLASPRPNRYKSFIEQTNQELTEIAEKRTALAEKLATPPTTSTEGEKPVLRPAKPLEQPISGQAERYRAPEAAPEHREQLNPLAKVERARQEQAGESQAELARAKEWLKARPNATADDLLGEFTLTPTEAKGLLDAREPQSPFTEAELSALKAEAEALKSKIFVKDGKSRVRVNPKDKARWDELKELSDKWYAHLKAKREFEKNRTYNEGLPAEQAKLEQAQKLGWKKGDEFLVTNTDVPDSPPFKVRIGDFAIERTAGDRAVAVLNGVHTRPDGSQRLDLTLRVDELESLDPKGQYRFERVGEVGSRGYGASNKLVTNERYSAAKERVKAKLSPNRANAGLDPSLLADLAEIGAYHVEAGTREFAAWSKRMIEDAGEGVRPYLQELHKRSLAAVGEQSETPNRRTIQDVTPRGETDAPRQGERERTDDARPVVHMETRDASGGRIEDNERAVSSDRPTVRAVDASPVVPPVTEREPTSPKNEVTAKERAERGLNPVEKQAYTAIGDAYLQGKQAVESGEVDPRALAQSVARRPRPLDATEVGVLGHDRAVLTNAEADTLHAMSDAVDKGDLNKLADLQVRLEQVQDALDLNDQALQKGGREQSAAFRARQMIIRPDKFELGEIIKRAKAKKGAKLTTEESLKFTELSKKRAAAKSEFADYESKREERAVSREAQDAVEQMKREVARIGRRQRRAQTREQLDTDFAAIKGRLAKAWANRKPPSSGTLGSTAPNFDPEGEITKALGEMALNRVKAGVNSAEQIADDIFSALKDELPGLTKRYVKEKVSLYGKRSVPSTDPIKAKLADMKEQLRLALAIEDVEAGKRPENSGYQPRARSATALAMRRELAAKMRAAGLVEPAPKMQGPRLSEGTGRKEGPRLSEAEGRTAGPRLTEAPKQGPRMSEARKEGPRLSEGTTRPEGPRDWLPDAKKRLEKQIIAADAELAQRRAGTYVEPPKRVSVPLDREGQRLKAKLAEVDNEIEQEILKKKKMSVGDYIAKIRQTFVLSGLGTLGKLSAAVTGRGAITLPEEITGSALSRIMPRTAAKAGREGYVNPRAIAQGAKQYFRGETYKEAYKKFRTGQHSLDLLYSDKKPQLNHPVLDFFGRVHGAFKTPAQMAEFHLSLEKRTAQARRQGRDLSSDVVQMELGTEAYADSKRAILMNDNLATDVYKSTLAILEKKAEASPDRLSGKMAKTAAVTGRVMFPVVKVPTNYAIEASSYLPGVGAAKGLTRMGLAKKADYSRLRKEGKTRMGSLIASRAVEAMTPSEADATLRAFKKQGIGLGLVAIGFFNPEMFGGYYDPNDKDKKIKPGDMKILGVTIPHKLLHTPAFEVMQWGATVRKVSEQRRGPRGHKTLRGLGEGTFRATLGLAEQTPFVDSVFDWGRAARDYNAAQSFVGDTTSGLITPSLLRDIAKWTDDDVTRKPQTFGQALELNLPVLRRRVPIKGGGRHRH